MSVNNTSYRWVSLIVLMFATAALNYTILLIPSMAVTIIGAYNLTQVQFATIASMPFLAGFILGIPSGTLGDKYGVKPVVAIGLILAVVGSGLRINASSYVSLMSCNFFIGVGVATIDANVAKYLNMWFKTEEIGTAMGLFMAATALGTSLAFATGNLYTNYQTALMVAFILLAVSFIAWMILAKSVERPDNYKAEPISNHLKVCFKSKNLWIANISIFLILGATLVINNFLTQALIVEKGITPVKAGLITTMLNVCLIIGSFVNGYVTSKTGRVKPVIVVISCVAGIAYYMAWMAPFGIGTYIFLIIAGLTAGGTIPVSKTIVPMIVKTGDFDESSVGTAGGIHSASQNLGAFIVPTYIVAAIAGQDFQMSFAIGSIIFIAAGLLNLLLPELGVKGN